MRLRCCRVLVAAMVLVLLLPAFLVLGGCSGGGGEEEVVGTLKKLPRNAAGFTFFDMAAFHDDRYLDDVYGGWKKIAQEADELGIPTDNISGVAVDTSTWIRSMGSVTVFDGQFALGDIRGKLRGNGYDEGSYKDVETWEGGSSVALVSESCIVVGDAVQDMRGCIDVMNDELDSLYDDEDMRDVFSMLSGRLLITIARDDLGREGGKAAGVAYAREDADTVGVTMIVLFVDGDAAGDAKRSIETQSRETYRADSSYRNLTVTQDGRHVKVTMDCDLKSSSE